MIDRAGFDDYARSLASKEAEAMALIRTFSKTLDWGKTAKARENARDLLSRYIYDVVTSYGDDAAAIAADYFDELALRSSPKMIRAIMAGQLDEGEVARAVDKAVAPAFARDPESGNLGAVDRISMARTAASLTGGYVRYLANQTMWDNAGRYGAKYARIPTSAHPCAFCTLLASQGFVYTTEKSAIIAHNMHKYHDNCSCVAISSFDDELEGYQDAQDEYYALYQSAADALPDKETRAMWKDLTEPEQSKYTRPNHPTWNGYANFRLHSVLSQMRSMHGIRS